MGAGGEIWNDVWPSLPRWRHCYSKEESDCMTVCGCACTVWVNWESLHTSMCICVIHTHIHTCLTRIWYFPKCWYVHYPFKPIQLPGEPCRDSMFEINSQDGNWLTQDLPTAGGELGPRQFTSSSSNLPKQLLWRSFSAQIWLVLVGT